MISDVQMPGPSGYELLSSIKRLRPDLPVVLMTAYGTIAQAVSAMREGATDYIVKPFEAQALIDMARRQLANRVTPNDLVAADPESKRSVSLARKIAENDATVLITGESGTGKEVYARFIRDHSGRSDKPFVAINCAAIPENMLEATLFGYEKGAFTGALSAHAGKFEQAQGGTLLLDEISEMDLGLQAKILRVLQEREVERLGGTRTISLDVRLIATSNRDLPEEVRAGRFRADLFYRLNVMSLRLPALRERRGDILPLARRAIQACARGNQAALALTAGRGTHVAGARLAGKCARADQHRAARGMAGVRREHRCLRSGPAVHRRGVGGRAAAIPMPGALTGAVTMLATGGMSGAGAIGRRSRRRPPPTASLYRDSTGVLKQRERELILATLRVTGGSRKLAAERLGISPRTLRHKLQQLKAAGVSVPRLHDQKFAAVAP